MEASPKWETVGEILGIAYENLTEIGSKNHNNVLGAFFAMFQYWLANTKEPSWNILIKALKQALLDSVASCLEDTVCVTIIKASNSSRDIIVYV